MRFCSDSARIIGFDIVECLDDLWVCENRRDRSLRRLHRRFSTSPRRRKDDSEASDQDGEGRNANCNNLFHDGSDVRYHGQIRDAGLFDKTRWRDVGRCGNVKLQFALTF